MQVGSGHPPEQPIEVSEPVAGGWPLFEVDTITSGDVGSVVRFVRFLYEAARKAGGSA